MTGDVVTIPARARDEIGELTFYLEQALRNLREVSAHIRGSSETMPDVLDVLREVNRMTEEATVRVLEETEALGDESRAAAELIAAVRDHPGPAVAATVEHLRRLDALVARGHERTMTIMAALEFQDLTAQKVHRALEVLGEVVERLRRIQPLVFPDAAGAGAPGPPGTPAPLGGKSGQALADEILMTFADDAVPTD
jgi:chemotaxis regulatin CheY-phosphate phosphatase CheZ